jgi:predicted amidohydrolase
MSGKGRSRSKGVYTLAVCQFTPVLFDVAGNLARIEDMARAAATGGARLAVFPECAVSGYATGEAAKRMADFAEPVLGDGPGPSVYRLIELSTTLDLSLQVGLAERAGTNLYNSAVSFAPHEGVTGVFHKVHLWFDDMGVFTPGEGFEVRPGPVGSYGSAICYDLDFPEAARTVALLGADLLALSTANYGPWEQQQRIFARARAAENQIYVAVANQVGLVGETEFFGAGMIVGPEGEVLADAGAEEMVVFAEIDVAAVAESRKGEDYLRQRRPEAYRIR